jgi:hypothetical protein
MYSVVCTVCKGGQTSNPSCPLSFTVASAKGVTIADFRPNVGGFYFASDILGNNGRTGNVAALTFFIDPELAAVAEVPEPVPFILVGTALLGLGLRQRFAAPG